MMPSIQTGNNTATVSINGVNLWFSYSTLIAFQVGSVLVVHQNDWSKTTGKHFNAIDGGGREAVAKRVDDDTFMCLYGEHVTF
jgi:hypothetical protein